jgi:outer membrane protein OmpA-like peptidoglycan-associated protein
VRRLAIVFAVALAAPAAAAPAPIHVTYDSAHLDLDKHELQFKPSRAVTEATLVAIGEDGSELGKGSATYTDAKQDWLAITWTQPANTKVMMLKLRVAAADGVATNVELVPWSVAVEHEDVNFATDSATIEPDEAKKLDASLAKIQDVVKRAEKFMKVRLYIAGHTDTVGPSAKNRKLSLARAQAIAKYFRSKGLAVPIAIAGFGEDVLKVKTADNTDERANRRADYVIGPAAGAPPFGGAYLKAKATWSQIK